MSKIENPFLVYGYEGPDFFCDREAETQELISALYNGCNVTLMSPRRYGKTGLIRNCFYHIAQQRPETKCFYIDIYPTKCLNDFVELLGQAIIGKLDTPAQRAEGFIHTFFRSCQLTMGVDPLTSLPQMGLSIYPQQERQTLEEIFAYIKQSDKVCYIAIDEFQQIGEYPEDKIEELLRSYVQSTHNVHFIFAGSKLHIMDTMFSSPKHPFYRSTERIPLDVLPESVYYDFAASRMQTKGLTLTQELFHQLYTLVDGVTWYVQTLLNRLYRLDPKELTQEDLQSALQQTLRSEEDGYKRQIHQLTQLQGRLLKAIAIRACVKEPTAGEFVRSNKLNSSSSVQRALKYLLDEEYVYRTELGYIVYDRFLGLWLRSQPNG